MLKLFRSSVNVSIRLSQTRKIYLSPGDNCLDWRSTRYCLFEALFGSLCTSRNAVPFLNGFTAFQCLPLALRSRQTENYFLAAVLNSCLKIAEGGSKE